MAKTYTIDGLHQKVSDAGVIRAKYFTTKPTTGLQKGDLIVLFHGSQPKLGVCSSSGAKTIKLIRLRTKTLGRGTA